MALGIQPQNDAATALIAAAARRGTSKDDVFSRLSRQKSYDFRAFSHHVTMSLWSVLKTLVKHIATEVEERGFCVVFENDLGRCWPLEEIAGPERKRAIEEFAESQGWSAAVRAFGTRAIFQKREAG
jgi:hypothetical protein